jgi:hypothetical protein
MKKKQFYILLSILLVAILIFSNPTEENHIQSVKSKLKIAFNKKMSSEINENQDDAFKTLENGIGLLLGDTFIDKLTDGIVSRNNYFLFSLTNAKYNEEEKIIGFGILGNVFLSDKIENIFQKDEQNKNQTEETVKKTVVENYTTVVNRTDAENGALKILKEYLEKNSKNDNEIKKVYTDEEGDLNTEDIDGHFLSVYGLSDAEIFSGDLNNDGKSEIIIVITNIGGGAGGNVEIIENYLITNNETVSGIDEELINAPKNEFGYNIYLTGIENGYVNIDFIYRNENDGLYSQGKEEKLKCKLINNKLKVVEY